MTEAAPLPPGTRPVANPDPRDAAVENAAAELRDFMRTWVPRHGLTSHEFLFICCTLAVRQAQAFCVAEREALRAKEVQL